MVNIERSVFRPGSYVGYGGGMVWHIARNGARAWRASPIHWIAGGAHKAFTAPRLRDISARLDAMPGNK